MSNLEKFLVEPFKHCAVNIRLAEKEYKQVSELAIKHQTSRNQIIRALIKKGIAENGLSDKKL